MSVSNYTQPASAVQNFPIPPVVPPISPIVVPSDLASDWPHWTVTLSPTSIPAAVWRDERGLQCAACSNTDVCAHRLAVVTSDDAPAFPAYAKITTEEDVDDVLTAGHPVGILEAKGTVAAALDALNRLRVELRMNHISLHVGDDAVIATAVARAEAVIALAAGL